MSDKFDEKLKSEPINLRMQRDDSADFPNANSEASAAPEAPASNEKSNEGNSTKSKFDVAMLSKKTALTGSGAGSGNGIGAGVGAREDNSLAKRVPLKPKLKTLPIIIWIFLIPVFAATVSLIVDPTAPYILQRHLPFGSIWTKESAAKLTAAINIRRDPELLRDRASVYEYLQMFKEQEKDLQELIDRGYGANISAFEMAKVRADQGIIDDKTKQLLHKTITDATAGGTNPGKEPNVYDLESAIWALTLEGDNKTAFSIESQDGYSDGAKQLMEGVATRELGDAKKAEKLFEESTDNLEKGDDWEGFPRYFTALLRLDKKDVGGAQKVMDKEVLGKQYPGYIVPAREIVRAWIAFAKGDLTQALSRSTAVINQEEKSVLGFGNLTRLSSAHYLRAHIYEQQGKKDLQRKEFAAYKKFAAGGKAFIPIPYRNW